MNVYWSFDVNSFFVFKLPGIKMLFPRWQIQDDVNKCTNQTSKTRPDKAKKSFTERANLPICLDRAGYKADYWPYDRSDNGKVHDVEEK